MTIAVGRTLTLNIHLTILIKKYLSAILVFYEINNIILRKKKIKVLIWRRARKRKDRAYTTEEIKKIVHLIDEFDSFFLIFPRHIGRVRELLPHIKLIMMLVHISKIMFVYYFLMSHLQLLLFLCSFQYRYFQLHQAFLYHEACCN